jgi:uncharacterized coiled-coil protein SlyX
MEGTMFGNSSRELEAQIAEQAKTIAKLSDDLLKIQGEFEALHVVVNVVSPQSADCADANETRSLQN